jgi:hypothetical protein
MIAGLDSYQLDEEEQEYYNILQWHMSEVGMVLGCTFEMTVLDINLCNLAMKSDKTLLWKQITIDGVSYILDTLLQQYQEKPLDQDQIETLQDAQLVD